MTKPEKAAFAALEAERDLYRSWRLTEAVEPDIPAGSTAIGWMVVGSGKHARVERAATSGVKHRIGDHAWENVKGSFGWYQGCPAMYSTFRLALQQQRHLLCMEAARQLADLDRRIAAAKEKVSYSCEKCGTAMTKETGALVFTVCDNCWPSKGDVTP